MNESTAPALGARLIALRESLGWSRRDLERASGVTDQTIANIEEGRSTRPGLTVAAQLASALGLTLDGLIRGDSPDENPPRPAHKKRGRRPKPKADNG